MSYISARTLYVAVAALALGAAVSPVSAETAAPQSSGAEAPTPAVTGSNDTLVNGKPALRAGDKSADGQTVVEGSSNVFINGKPAAVVGSQTDCGKGVVTGSSNVFVNGKPLATAGSGVAPCKK